MTRNVWHGRSIHFCLTNPEACYICNPRTGEPQFMIWDVTGRAARIRLIRSAT